MLLYINACVRTESRTRVIADALVSKYSEPVTEVVLEKTDFPKVDGSLLLFGTCLFPLRSSSILR